MRLLILSFLASFCFYFTIGFSGNSSADTLRTTATEPVERECAADELRTRLFAKFPDRRRKHLELEGKAYRFFNDKNSRGQKDKTGGTAKMADFTLPVVFHIVHENGPENITDAQVLAGLQNLNDAFANINFYDQGIGLDTKIEFCLAKRDPGGNPTTGINRIVSPLTNVTFGTDIAMKDLIRWDPLQYINIWLVRSINNGSVAGYAYLPSSHGQPEDGIVMLGSLVPQLGSWHAVLVHEMGHYLGLYHTFEGSCTNNNCLADGDRVCDTPPDGTTAPPGDCSASINSCTSDANSGFATDQNDLNWNYMDYGNLPCQSGFTQGQSDRMEFFVENVRQSLLNSPACQQPCLTQIAASFNASATVVNVGSAVNFTNTTTGGTNYVWQVDGVIFATSANAGYTFNTLGLFEITLLATNSDPNCSGSFSQTIEVICPVSASFSTSNLYPAPGETVDFTNQSSNASNYQWTVNGAPAATSTDFSNAFPDAGAYQICLEAGNGLCEKEFCQLVFVLEGAGGDCVSPFIRRIGNLGINEESFHLTPSPDGNFYLAGQQSNYSVLLLIDQSGNILAKRAFDFTTGNDFIANIMVDSEGFIIGSSRDQLNTNTVNVLFKYDWGNDLFLWSKRVTNPAYIRFDGIYENPLNGNYVFHGMATGAIDNYVLEVNRNTGNVQWQFQSDQGANGDVLSGHFATSNAVYFAGQGRLAGGLDDIRPTLTKFDHSGNMQWVKIHLKSPAQSSRLYNMNLIVENDTIVNIGRGSLSGSNLTSSVLLFYKTSIDGDLYWAKSYTVNGGSGVAGYKVNPIPDGYIVQGTYDQNGTTARLFFARLDKNGNVVWAKRINTATAASGITKPLSLISNGFVVFAAQTQQYDTGSNNDFLFGQISLDGQAGSAGCDLIEDIDLIASNITNPYDGFQPPVAFQPAYVYSNFSPAALAPSLAVNDIPGCECPEVPDTCANGLPLHTVPDAFFQNISAQCAGDSMTVNLEICNGDSVELAQGTPVSFYENNPTSAPTSLLGIANLPGAVAPGACENFTIKITLPANSEIFAVVNDSGVTPTPFDLASDFPNTATQECDYTNNISSFEVNYVPPMLDLGADLIACHFEATVLDAGGGFSSYQWFNGSKEQVYTAWEPGTYWVEANDVCGGVQRDSITIAVDPGTLVEIGFDSVVVCEGENFTFTVGGFDGYQWFPAALVDCDTCATVTVSPGSDTFFILVAGNSDGCYSADTVFVAVTAAVETSDTMSFCTGDTVLIFGNPVTMAGDYSQLFTGVNGCDSTYTITLVEAGDTIFMSEMATICQGDSIEFFGQWLTAPGTYENFDATGSCVIHNLFSLSVLDTFATSETIVICENETADIFGTPTGAAGTYVMTFQTAGGCDSTHTITLSVLDTFATSETIVICENETADIFGTATGTAGTYSMTFQTAGGCDSTHTITLSVLDTFATSETIVICENETVDIFGTATGTAGTYAMTFQTAGGCDSTHTITLSVLDTFATGESIVICENEMADIFGTPTGTAGTYAMTFQTAGGCDSTHTIALSVLDTFATSETIVICENETADVFGTATNVPGVYSQSFPSVSGCDSTHTITLVVNGAYDLFETIAICAGDSALIFGVWETQPGEYQETSQTAAGCDSTVTVTLLVSAGMAVSFETMPACPNDLNGELTATVTGGLLPYSFAWSTGSNSPDGLTGLAAGGYGLTVTDAAGCTLVASATVSPAPMPVIVTEIKNVSCHGLADGVLTITEYDPSLEFSVSGSGFSDQTMYANLSGGGVQLLVQDTFGCVWEENFTVNEPSPVFIQLPGDVTIELGETFEIYASTLQNDLTFAWFPDTWLSCNDCLSPLAQPAVTTLYTVTVAGPNGCQAVDSILISVEFSSGVYTPNVFSPNGDGINDAFYLMGKGIAEVRLLRIFDRWGEKVYERTNFQPNEPLLGWNGTFKGKPMNAGVFVYYAVVGLIDGSEQIVKGDVTLLR